MTGAEKTGITVAKNAVRKRGRVGGMGTKRWLNIVHGDDRCNLNTNRLRIGPNRRGQRVGPVAGQRGFDI